MLFVIPAAADDTPLAKQMEILNDAYKAIKKEQDIREVLDTASEQTSYSKADFIKSHFFPLYDSSKALPIVTGPYGLISIVHSDLFPVEASECRYRFS
jgi:hypothetical protein